MILRWITLLLLLIPFSKAYPKLTPANIPTSGSLLSTCSANTGLLLTQEDFAAKLKHGTSTCVASATIQLDSSEDGSCSESMPCSNGACCSKSGWCGFGPDFCGTDKHSPNEVCWSNCNAKAECGQYADDSKECPLKICCSQYGFCGVTEDFCAVTDDPKTSCQSNCDQPDSGRSEGNVQKRIIGYYEAWNHDSICRGMKISDIPTRSLTHLYFAFGFISPDTFGIVPMPNTSHDLFRDVAAIKKDNPDLKVLIALGGWGFNDNNTIIQPVFHNLVSKSSARKIFISNLLIFLRGYGFDGVDFDWEYPGASDRGGGKYDGENFALLLKELEQAIAKDPADYLVSFTAPTSYWYLRHFTHLSEYMDHVDWVNVMTYDLHGVWDKDSSIGSYVLAHTNLTGIKEALNLFWRNDINPAKVNLGLGFYGRSFQLADPSCNTPGCLFKGGGAPGECTGSSGTLSYREIMAIMDKEHVEPYHDTENAVKYLTWKDQWVSFDDIDTFQEKISFANSIGLGGLFIWALDHDTPDFDALQGVIHPKTLGSYGAEAEAADHWRNAPDGDCRVTDCGINWCKPGEIIISTASCGKTDEDGVYQIANTRAICCPLSSAPNPSDCVWRGSSGYACNGQCHANEMTLHSSKWGNGGDPCWWGVRVFCCPVANKPDCRWTECTEACSDSEDLMTWTHGSCSRRTGSNERNSLCCSKEKKWRNCDWYGNPGQCDNNRCEKGQVALAVNSSAEDMKLCFLSRKLTYCCDPPEDEEVFLPVPLDYLFPDAPPADEADSEFTLKLDSENNKDKSAAYNDDPDNSAFGFVVLTSPEAVQITLDKRDGSHWEFLDCFNGGEVEHTVRMTCTNDASDSDCHKIHLGRGVPGKILEMPGGCGPGRYAVAKSLEVSANHSLPHHLRKRGVDSVVYDLTFDYNFHRVPRDLGKTHVRIDYSNQPGYWDGVVDKAATHKRKRDLSKHRNNHKRWLEEAWREDRHGGHLDHDELHKRWFGSDVLDWLKGILGGGFSGDVEFKYSYRDDFIVKLIEERYGPCDINGVEVSASLDVKAEAHVEVDTTYGFTLITTLDFPPDLSNSYLFFRNRGEATAKFTVDALATATFRSGDFEFLSADKFGAAFTVPGILTIGPNFKLLGSVEGEVSVSGNLQAQVKLADWDVRQTYPVASDEWNPEAEKEPSRSGTQPIGEPEITYEVRAHGFVIGHIKPVISFGIDFKKTFIDIPSCKVDLVGDGHLTFHAWASTGSEGSEFCYEAIAGAELYAALDAPPAFRWALPQKDRFDITRTDSINVIEQTCPVKTGSTSSTERTRRSPRQTSSLEKRARVYGPPDIFKLKKLKCPGEDEPIIADYPCSCGDEDGELSTRQASTCAYFPGRPGEPACNGDVASLDKSGSIGLEFGNNSFVPIHPVQRTRKLNTWSVNGVKYTIYFQDYPSCAEAAKNKKASRWWGFGPTNNKSPACPLIFKKFKSNEIGSSQFQADHIYEAQALLLFFKWLSSSSETSIPWPNGYTRPQPEWVLGKLMGVAGTNLPPVFTVKQSSAPYDDSLWLLAAREIGAYGATENRLALLEEGINNNKGTWFQLSIPQKTMDTIRDTKRWQRDVAGVFQYLKDDTINKHWREVSWAIEGIMDDFDKQYKWNDPGMLVRPTRQSTQPRPGLRDLYCFFIDAYLREIEKKSSVWARAAKQELESDSKTDGAEKQSWIKTAMSPPGIVTPTAMTFKKFGSAWTPGTNKEVLKSQYGMWQMGRAGPW